MTRTEVELRAVMLGGGWNVGEASSVVPNPTVLLLHPPEVHAWRASPYSVKGLSPDTTVLNRSPAPMKALDGVSNSTPPRYTM